MGKFSLLRDNMFGVATTNGHECLTLPNVLSLLGSKLEQGGIDYFSALQAHQKHAWYSFLVFSAVHVLHDAGEENGVQTPSFWFEGLCKLGGGEEAWELVVEDLSKPAFFQPPLTEGTLEGFTEEPLPDSFDLLVTSQNLDRKKEKIWRASPEHWVYSLLSTQMSDGYLGAGWYGAVRMNGGYGSRPCVAFYPATDWHSRFIRDVRVLLRERHRIVETYGYQNEGGEKLLWLTPWDGKTQRSLETCDPYFLEFCRRVRLVENNEGGISSFKKVSKTSLFPAYHGLTGDPWTPIFKEKGVSLSLSEAGFKYGLLADILFSGKYQSGISQQVYADDPENMYLVAMGMARGEGKTRGLHERTFLLPRRVRFMLGEETGREHLYALTKNRIEAVATVEEKVLANSVAVFLQKDPERLKLKEKDVLAQTLKFTEKVDLIFFESLWSALDMDPEEADLSWKQKLVDLAQQQLQEVFDSTPFTSIQWHRMVCLAERKFWGKVKHHLPELKKNVVEEESPQQEVA